MQVNSQLNKIAIGAILARAVAGIAELGIADQIEPGKSRKVRDIAAACGCHERALYRTLRFLASNGIFKEVTRDETAAPGDRAFELTPLAAVLRSDAPHSYRPAARMFRRLFSALPEFDHCLQTSGSALEKILGKPLFDYLPDDPGLAELFDASMSSIHSTETKAIIDAYDFSQLGTLADLGGGNGSLLIAILERTPELKGILMDLGHVADRGAANLHAAALDARCQVMHVDFFQAVPKGADAIVMRHIIHDWDDETSIRILRAARAALPSSGKLLVIEPLVPQGNDPSPAKDMDMRMLCFPGGMERTEAEYKQLFAAAGLELDRITPTQSAVSIIEARPV